MVHSFLLFLRKKIKPLRVSSAYLILIAVKILFCHISLSTAWNLSAVPLAVTVLEPVRI